MQVLSHGTRAYIWNSDGLQGFLVELDVIKIFIEAEAQGQLEDEKKYQEID